MTAGQGDDLQELVDQGVVTQSTQESPVIGRVPLKVIADGASQQTANLTFDLKPGAIVAHANANVVFVCG